MGFQFEWDPAKAKQNLKKHRVSFEEAATVFGHPFALTIPDPIHSLEEDRELFRVLVVVFTDRGDRIRIISARHATRKESRDYEEGSQK